MKRFLVVLATAGALVTAAAAPALADATPNNHNCEGAVVSSLTPGVTSDHSPPDSFPDSVTTEAHDKISGPSGGSHGRFKIMW